MDATIDFGFVLPHWLYWGWLAVMPIVMILLCYYQEGKKKKETDTAETAADQGDAKLPTPSNKMTRTIDWISEHTGMFVGFWTVNAVFVYAFEVIARYLFNSPTIWVHESAFLLFGMQYLISGAYAYLHGSHVAVDIIYNKFPERGRYGLDIFTSIFSFIFFITLVGTSWRFAIDSIAMNERTVETWQITYGPVKMMMFIGGVLLILALVSKLYKDIQRFNQLGRSI